MTKDPDPTERFLGTNQDHHPGIENNEKALNLFELTAEMKELLINHIITYDKDEKNILRKVKK